MALWAVLSLSTFFGFIAVFSTLGGVSESVVLIQPSIINCTTYNSSAPCISTSISPYCLQNGTSVNGFCKAEVAVCVDMVSLDTSFDACTNSGNDNSSSISLHGASFYLTTTTTVAMVIAANVGLP